MNWAVILPIVLKKQRNRQNNIMFILPIGIFLLSFRQNIAVMSTIIGRKQEIDELWKSKFLI